MDFEAAAMRLWKSLRFFGDNRVTITSALLDAYVAGRRDERREWAADAMKEIREGSEESNGAK